MNTEQPYTPSEANVRAAYVLAGISDNASSDSIKRAELSIGPEFDRFIAQVRRDAAREALDGFAEWADLRIREAVTDRGADDWRRTRSAVTAYRDRHHPEETR